MGPRQLGIRPRDMTEFIFERDSLTPCPEPQLPIRSYFGTGESGSGRWC